MLNPRDNLQNKHTAKSSETRKSESIDRQKKWASRDAKVAENA
jgi:hypothetical protein